MPYVHDVLMCATYGTWSVLYDNFLKHLHFVLGHTYTPTEVSNICIYEFVCILQC